MKETNIENEKVILQKNIETFFKQSTALQKKTGKCMVKDELALLLDKWSIFVLYNLAYYQIMRFTDLKSKIRGVSSKMLSVSLKKLAAQGIINRKVYAEVPPKVEYNLTDYGVRLTKQVLKLNKWFLDQHTI